MNPISSASRLRNSSPSARTTNEGPETKTSEPVDSYVKAERVGILSLKNLARHPRLSAVAGGIGALGIYGLCRGSVSELIGGVVGGVIGMALQAVHFDLSTPEDRGTAEHDRALAEGAAFGGAVGMGLAALVGHLLM